MYNVWKIFGFLYGGNGGNGRVQGSHYDGNPQRPRNLGQRNHPSIPIIISYPSLDELFRITSNRVRYFLLEILS
jgi:hypothetical protein